MAKTRKPRFSRKAFDALLAERDSLTAEVANARNELSQEREQHLATVETMKKESSDKLATANTEIVTLKSQLRKLKSELEHTEMALEATTGATGSLVGTLTEEADDLEKMLGDEVELNHRSHKVLLGQCELLHAFMTGAVRVGQVVPSNQKEG